MGVAAHLATSAAGQSIAAGSTTYWGTAGGVAAESRLIDWAVDGIFSDLMVRVTANAATAGSTATFRKNSADTAMTVAIGAGQTGLFQDSSTTVSVVTGDDVSFKIVAGTGGAITADLCSALFETDDAGAVTFAQMAASVTLSTASQTAYMPIWGRFASAQTTESHHQQIIRAPGTAKRFQVHITTNPRTTTTTFRTRKNGANGAQSVAIGSTQTGRFVDSTNTDTLSAGDLLCFQYVLGTGTAGIVVDNIGVALHATTRKQDLTVGFATGLAYTNNAATIFFKPAGDLGFGTPETVETNRKMPLQMAAKATNLRVRLSANARAVTQTATLRKNGADTAQTVAIGASQTGLFEDTTVDTHDVDVSATDEIAIALATGASASSATIRLAGVTLRLGGVTGPQIRAAGSFAQKPAAVRIGGSFVEKQMSVRVGGSWQGAD